MSKYLVDGTDMTSVANAIRTKGGTSAQLEFPSGFVSAIGNISGGGGASNIVTGTFDAESTDAGTIKDISLGYSGSGFPIACIIYPSVGAKKSGADLTNLVQKKIITFYANAKEDVSLTPDYSGNTDNNFATMVAIYKTSDSDATSYTAAQGTVRTYYTGNPSGSGSAGNSVRFKDASTMRIYIANTNEYGFYYGAEYTYYVIYSS